MRTTSTRDLLRALLVGLILFAQVLPVRGLWRGVPPSIAYLQGAVIVGVSMWWAWKAVRRERLVDSPVTLPLAVLVGSVVLSAAFSVDARLSVSGVLEVLFPVLCFFIVCDLLLAGWPPGVFVDAVLIAGALVLAQACGATWRWYSEWWQARVPEYPPFLLPFRVYGIADHPNLLAPLINLGLPFAILRLAEERRLVRRLAYALWLGAATVVLFFTRSRGGWMGTAAVLAITVGWLVCQRRPARSSDLCNWLRRSSGVWLATGAYLALFGALSVADARLSPSLYTTNGGSLSELAGRPLFWSIAWRDFVAHPLTGSGPLTYAGQYVNGTRAIRAYLAPHAHNLFLSTLAEEGLAGLAALVWVLAASVVALARGWRLVTGGGSEPGRGRQSQVLVGVWAGLAAVLFQAQVDVPWWLPANAVLCAVLLALGLDAVGAVREGRDKASRWRLAVLAAPMLLLCLLGRQNAAQAALTNATELAAEGDWRAAAHAMDQAVAADPAFRFYQAQRGYAYGVLADPLTPGCDVGALDPAIRSYFVALQAGPEYVPDLLNAAWLEERAGATHEAERLLERAVQRGADWALPALLLGQRYALQGKDAEAARLFDLAFAREPQAREMAACRQSPACREAAGRSAAEGSEASRAHERARTLLAAGRPKEAVAALAGVPIVSTDPLPWLDRADAYVAMGQCREARYALRVAQVLCAERFTGDALSLAAYHRMCGRAEDAIAVLEAFVRPKRDATPYSLVYHRFGLPGALVPSLDMLQRTAEDLAVYRQLAELYAAERRSDDAAWAEGQAKVLAGLLGEAGGQALLPLPAWVGPTGWGAEGPQAGRRRRTVRPCN